MNGRSNANFAGEADAASFETAVLHSPQPVVVEFWAPWSQPCRRLDSTLAELWPAWAGQIKVVRVNADDNPALSLWYDVHSIPMLLFFVAGALRARVVGTASKEAILSALRSASLPPAS